MGYYKNLLIQYSERGYSHSGKYICSKCTCDEYLKNFIKKNGVYGKCSFCLGRRKTLDFDSFTGKIKAYIEANYDSAAGNLPYEKKAGYLGTVVDTYEIIDNISSNISENEEVLTELKNILELEIYTSEFKKNPYELDDRLWDEFCAIVSSRKESAEVITSMCSRNDSPTDIYRIKEILDIIISISKDLHMTDTLGGLPIYRAVSFHKFGETTPGFNKLLANTIGTPPPQHCKDNRFSESGDMVFYGASNKEIVKLEIGNPPDSNPFTIGTFYANKRVSILKYSSIQDWKRPSIFDLGKKELREYWFFINRFVELISQECIVQESYKPTQVLMKYIQRNTKYYGIEYRSSKSSRNSKAIVIDKCYALFVTNRDCIDESEVEQKLNKTRFQLVMKSYEQIRM